MKLIRLFGLLLASSTLQAQTLDQATVATNPSPVNFFIGQQDANSRVWQKVVQSVNSKGNIVYQTNQAYVELSTCLNFWRNGQWNASTENIQISPDGGSASATNGAVQAFFPGDIYGGAIKLIGPDQQVIETEPIGLALSDGSNSVLLAATTNSTGAILPAGNCVIYTNFCAGLACDLVLSYTRSGFAQDIVLKQQLPDPSVFNLKAAKLRLQVITEFIAPPPSITTTTVPTEAGNLQDDNLSFGAIALAQGKAFVIGTNSPLINTTKRWVAFNGRQFLIEEIPLVSIATAIDSLPPYVAQAGIGIKPVVSKNLIPPPRQVVHNFPKTRFLAKAEMPRCGLLLDYQTINGGLTNYVFRGDSTYFLSGTVNLWGINNVIEGGTCLKYTNNAALLVNHGTTTPAVQFQTSAYRPAIFTAWNDNSVGEAISGSTGSVTNNCANPALGFTAPAFAPNIANFRIAYAQQAISLAGTSPTIADGQFINCQNGIFVNGAGGNLENLLFANVVNDFSYSGGGSVAVENATFSGSSYLEASGASLGLAFTNCIFANVTNLYSGSPSGFGGDHNGFYQTQPFGTATNGSSAYPFQWAGAGHYCLTNGCVFINAGTTNIDPVLLADLRTRTIYPPARVYTNSTITNGLWVPLVQRDTNAAPAIGYHYAPIDYAVSKVSVSGTLTLSSGVAVASFQSASQGSLAPGFLVSGAGVQLTSVGTAVAHNQICHYAAVQENPVPWGSSAFQYAVPVVVWGSGMIGSSPAVLSARFTDFNGLAGLGSGAVFTESSPGGVQIGGGDPMEFNLRDCRIGPGWLVCDTYQGSDTNLCFNNLLDRGGIFISDFDGDSPVTMQNNLFHNGYVTFDNEFQTYTWTVQNNFFDNTALSPGSGGLSQDHNGYWNTTQLTPTNVNDVLVTNFIYATGTLGNYYQVSTNLLNEGNTTAATLGLDHYTVQTNLVAGVEVVEATNTVSIGFHYVAVDQYGNPLDNNGDGIPDYLEDANGNGIYDSGDLGDWQGLNLNVIITRPRNGGILP
jgi:hypothetical protein